MMNIYVGVDCGATNLRVGVAEENGHLIASSKVSSPLRSDFSQLAQKVMDQINLLMEGKSYKVLSVGVGVPGPLDLKKGLVLPSANLGNSEPLDLTKQFESVFNAPIYFDRDTNLALLGEAWRGPAVSKKEVVMLTIGTGVGGAIMTDGRIDRGASGKGGEIGHMVLWMEVPPKDKLMSHPYCVGGKNWDPGTMVVRHRHQLNKDHQTFRCGLGHENCLEALINSAKSVKELGSYLGYGLANVVDLFNPEMIVIGGGKVNMGDFLPQAVCVMKEVGMKPAVDEVEVCYAKLEELSGVYGGIKLAIEGTYD